MLGGLKPIESNLHKHLIEHLNAEIVLGTITNGIGAMSWISSTFLYIRARKNPGHYGFNPELSLEQIDRKLLGKTLAEKWINRFFIFQTIGLF